MSDQRFLVSARKYRPQLFSELVAQEHVTGTLKNAVRLDRLGHAYLFSGPRGVGKTTAARILAKAINCTTAPEQRADEAEPCRLCESCRSFEEGRNLNIFEIDAASHNGVEYARDLNEKVRIPPQGGRKKVYIVDEVHMMTTQAFNALLKTLEEPPEHILFIFATTEPHKVLPTIQSRCQRFDFRRIPVGEIMSRLTAICATENVTADEGSLMLIARKGDGALRDALSVFDQAVSLCGNELRIKELVAALGVVSEDLYFDVTDRIVAGDAAGMLRLVDSVVSAGYDLQEFLDGLAEHLRNILVAATMPNAGLIEASKATRQRYADVSGSIGESQTLRLLAVVDSAIDGLRTARQPRLRLELALLKMAMLPSSVDLRAALDRIESFARDGVPEAKALPPSASAPAGPAPSAPEPRPARTSEPTTTLAGAAARPAVVPLPTFQVTPPPPHPRPRAGEMESAASTPTAAPTEAPADSAPHDSPPFEPDPVPPRIRASTDASGPAKVAEPENARPKPISPAPRPDTLEDTRGNASIGGLDETPDKAPDGSPDDATIDTPPIDPNQGEDNTGTLKPPASKPTGLFPAAPPPPPPPPAPAPAEDLFGGSPDIFGKPALAPRKPRGGDASGSVAVLDAPADSDEETPLDAEWPAPEIWKLVLKRVAGEKIRVGALLSHAAPEGLRRGTFVLRVPDEFHGRVLREASDDLIRILAEVTGEPVAQVRIVVDEQLSGITPEQSDDFDPKRALEELCEEYPAIRDLMERFGSEIVW